MTAPILAWHFVGDKLRDGRPVPADGEVLRHDGELELCGSGLHASERLIDALTYAPRDVICRVELRGKMVRDEDKIVACERIILWRVDGSTLLRDFARWCALQVIHLWTPPDIVRRYLETGDETIRAAARRAARGATEAAAEATRTAAWDTDWTAAWTARATAWASAWATRDAPETARAAARAAQNDHLTAMVEAEHARLTR